MRDSIDGTDTEYEGLRGDTTPSVGNFIRWERIKLREACQDAVRLLESTAAPTREYLDYMFTSDVGMNEIRARISKHRARLAELEGIQSGSTLSV